MRERDVRETEIKREQMKRKRGKERAKKNRQKKKERKKKGRKAEGTHTLRTEIIFQERVTSLGLPKAHLAPGKPKVFAMGEAEGCVSESKWILPPKVPVPTWTRSHGKKKKEGAGKGNISQS